MGARLIALLSAWAFADEPETTSYTGRVVAIRTLVAPRGGLPEESLEPLLRVQQDRAYSPYDVRQDIALLYRVGDFAQVEADVEPWVAYDALGEPVSAVRVEYRVWRPPAVATIEVQGNRAMPRRDVLVALGVGRGDAWRHEDPTPIETQVARAYRDLGFPRARVTIEAPAGDDGDVTLRVRIDEGAAQKVAEVRVRAGGAVPDGRIRGVLARHGIAAGRRWTDARLRAAQDEVAAVVRRAGWYEARVNLKLTPVDGGDRIAVLVDPRRRFTIVHEGHRPFLGWATRTQPTRREVIDQLGLEEGFRLGRDFGQAATDTLNDALRDQGWLESDVRVGVEEAEDRVVLRLTGDRGRPHVLRGFTVYGNPVYSRRFLRGALRDGDEEVLGRTWVLFGRPRLTEEALDRALRETEEFYRSQGYLSAALTREAFRPDPGRAVVPVDVTVRAEAGPRAVLRAVQVQGADDAIPAGELFSSLIDAPLDPEELADGVREFVLAHRERGYFHADARVQTTVSADGTAAEALVRVTPGPLVYLRTVVMRGYRRTKRFVLEREVPLRSGDVLSPSAISGIRRGLYDLGVFSRVSVEALGDEDRVKDLVIDVEERPNLHFEAGGGLATDQGARVFARAGHRNLFGLGHRLTVFGQVGLGWVGDGWTFDTVAPEWRAAMRYEAPHIPTRGERVATDILFNEQEQEATFRLQRTGGDVSVRLRVGDIGHAEVGYGVQVRRMMDVDPGVLVVGDPWLDELEVTDLTDPRPVLDEDERVQSGLDLALVVDLRDDLFNPTRGGIGNLAVEVTDEILSDVSFLKGQGAWTHYVPAPWGLGVELRARAGMAVVPGGGLVLPIEDRFRLGGGASFRGFEIGQIGPANEVSSEHIDYPDALGPIVAYAGRDVSARWVGTGGDAMAAGTAELHIPFSRFGLKEWSAWQLALFTDFGNVWWIAPEVETDSMREQQDPALRWSAGLGIRRSTAIGPIQVDVGFNPQPLTYREEDIWRLHVSLGAL